jgi:hypothetical protein
MPALDALSDIGAALNPEPGTSVQPTGGAVAALSDIGAALGGTLEMPNPAPVLPPRQKMREEPFTDPMSGRVLGMQTGPELPPGPLVEPAKFAFTAGARGLGSLADFAADPLYFARYLVSPELAQAERKAGGPAAAPGSAAADAFFKGTGIPESKPESIPGRLALAGAEGLAAGGPFGLLPAALSAAGGVTGQGTMELTDNPRLAAAASLATMAAGGAGSRLVGEHFRPAPEQAASRIARRGPDINAISEAFAAPEAQGKPLAIADVANPAVQGLGEVIANRPGPGAKIAEDFLNNRDAGAGPRLLGDLNDAMGAGPSAFKTAQTLANQRQLNSTPLYNRANSAAPLHSERLEQFTNEPIVKQGLAQGMEIERLERLAKGDQFDPASYSVTLDEAGAPSFAAVDTGASRTPNKPVDIVEHLIRSGGVSDQGGELAAMDMHQINKGYFGRLSQRNGRSLDYARESAEEAGYLPKGSSVNDMLDAIYDTTHGRPIYSSKDSHQVANWEQYVKSGELPAQASPAFGAGQAFDPNEMFKGLPRGWNMQTLDAAKRGLDNMLEQYRDPTSGRLALDQRGRAVDQVRKAFLDEIDRLNPDYKAARQAWSGPSQSMGAMKQGADIFNLQPEQIAENVQRLAPGDKDFFLLGARDALAQRIAKTSAGGNEALRIVGNQHIQNQLRPLFNSDAEFNSFIGRAQLESAMYRTKQNTLGNSRTFRRLANEAADEGSGLSGALGSAAQAGGAIMAHEPFAALPALMRTGRAIAQRITRPSPEVDAQIARMLYSGEPAQNARALEAIRNGKRPVGLLPLMAPGLLSPLLTGERGR